MKPVKQELHTQPQTGASQMRQTWKARMVCSVRYSTKAAILPSGICVWPSVWRAINSNVLYPVILPFLQLPSSPPAARHA